jgi:dihydroorotase
MRLFNNLTLPASADFHVHLRDGEMMEAVTPTIRQGGVNTVFVMPNLVPPITTIEHCLSYQQSLQALAPNVTFLMSLYLHPSITPDTIREAKKAGITGVKSYPAGVTTNSASGVFNYEIFYPVFAAMEEEDMVLNLHGEVPPTHSPDTTVLNAEESFLPTFFLLHAKFPTLRIVLEHCTTAAALDAVRACAPNVVGTITAHHLFLSIDDVVGDPLNFCKPVAKLPSDRVALLQAALGGEPKFFLGTDSAPHPLHAKRGGRDEEELSKCAAGVFTQPYATQLVLEAAEMAERSGLVTTGPVLVENLIGFLGRFGREFYRVPETEEKIRVLAKDETVQASLLVGDPEGGNKVVPFRRKEPIYSLEWI